MSGHVPVAGFQGGKFVTTFKYHSICGENGAVDEVVCREWKENTIFLFLQWYDPSDVFIADKTGLYWCLLPDKTHAVSRETCTGGKKSKERIT